MTSPVALPCPRSPLLATLLTLGLATAPAWADTTMSASSTASTSAGSASASLGQSSGASSQSSTSGAATARGPYVVQTLHAMAGDPGRVRLTLQALPEPNQPIPPAPSERLAQLELRLPTPVAQRIGLQAGHTVWALPREHGLLLAAGSPQAAGEPFFLVLDDAWHRQLTPQRVGG